MNGVLLLLLNFCLIIIELISCYLLAGCFSTYKVNKRKLWLSGIALFAIVLIILSLASGNIIVKSVPIVMAYTLWFLYVFKMTPMRALFISLIFYSFMLTADFIFLLAFNVWDRKSNAYLSNPYVYYLFCYAVKAIELCVVCVVKAATKKHIYPALHSWQGPLRTIMFPFMSVILITALMYIYMMNQEAAPVLLLCAVVLIGVDMLAIVLMNFLEKQQQELQDYAILKRTMQTENDNITAWINAYANQRKQTHEYQNKLIVIRGLIQQEAPNGKSEQYVAELLHSDFTDALFVKSGRAVADAVLNQKHALAQQKGVTLKVQLDDLSQFALSDEALVTVLSNLIDNAINACVKIPEKEKRIIKLTMRALPEVNFLFIENPTIEPVRIENNEVIVKELSWEHGYGLKNVAAVLRQSNAIYDINYDENTRIFRFSAQIIPKDN